MDIKFKSTKELQRITERSKIKDYNEHNKVYLEKINSVVERTAQKGTVTFVAIEPEFWQTKFAMKIAEVGLKQDTRSWYQILQDLKSLLEANTDWRVSVMKRKYYYDYGSAYELSISWGGN